MKIKICLILIILFVAIFGDDRNEIDFTVNPNCTEKCFDPWVIYGLRQDKHENRHYLYGAVNKPTFMMLSGSVNSNLKINWTGILYKKPKSLNVSDIDDVFGFSIQNIILFNDVNDTGTMKNIPVNETYIVSTSHFKWSSSMPEQSNLSEYPVYFSSNIFMDKELSNNAGILLNITSYIKDGRSEPLPHLIVSQNSSFFEISLINLVSALNETFPNSRLSRFTHPRLAVDMMIFGSKHTSSFTVIASKSLDDEHTPGIFSIDNIVSKSVKKNGFMQWRPVAYLTTKRDINFATRANFNNTLSPVDQSHLIASRDSLVYYLFGNDTMQFSATQSVIAFGRPKDESYTATNYTVWAFSFGLGDPPSEGFSTSVIVVITIATGLPVVLLVFAMLYWTVIRSRV